VMRGEPDWNRLPVLPPALTVFLKRCLQKDPRQRVADIHDVRLALDGAFDVPVSTANPSSPNDGRRHRSLPWSIGVAVLTGMSGLLGWMLRPDTAPPVPVSREVISAAPSPPVALTGGTFVDVAISPDGQNVVYQSSVAPAQVVVRALDALEGIPLRGPESVLSPVVSPDGEWVAFQTGDGTLARAPIQGGPPMTICPLPASLRGASWGRDGTIVFGLSQPGGLWRVPAAGGVPEPLTTADNGETDAYPDLLPNGAGVVFTIGRTNGSTLSDTRIAVADLRTGEQRVIIETGTSPRYTSDHIVYAVGNSLLAVPFDPERLEVTGDPVPMMDGVLTKSGGATSFALSETGSLVYVTTGEGGGTFARPCGSTEPATKRACRYLPGRIRTRACRPTARASRSACPMRTAIWRCGSTA
jgi:hypothetical protein